MHLFLCDFLNSGKKACLPLSAWLPPPAFASPPPPPPVLYKRSQSQAPSKDKAVIQPGSSDIPARESAAGAVYEQCWVPGGGRPCPPAHKPLLFAFLFFSKC